MSRTIEADYFSALKEARYALASLPFAEKAPDKVRGLSGWVFEQVLLRRLSRALANRGVRPIIKYQEPISGRATVDFVIGSVAVEAKVSGAYDDFRPKYRRYRKTVESKGWHYVYVTLEETYKPNVRRAQEVFGRNRAFFLDRPREWGRLISTIVNMERNRAETSGTDRDLPLFSKTPASKNRHCNNSNPGSFAAFRSKVTVFSPS